MDGTDRSNRHVVAVFCDRAEADDAVRALTGVGVGGASIRVGDRRDDMASVYGEMREELDHAVPVPGGGSLPTDMARGVGAGVLVGAVVGAVIGLPFALVPMGGLAAWARIVIVVLVGALAGAAIGFVIGGSLAAKGPGDPLAAQRGVTVAVTTDLDRARAVLLACHPIRMDIVDGGDYHRDDH
jgi:hypothetical protein